MDLIFIALTLFFALTTFLGFFLFTKSKFREQKELEKNSHLLKNEEVLNRKISELEFENREQTRLSQMRVEDLQNKKLELSNKVHAYQESEDQRRRLHDEKVSQLNKILEHQNAQKEKEEQFKLEQLKLKQEALKKTWVTHEKHVEEKFDLICQKRGLTSVRGEEFPFRGRPDNAALIGEDYVIFDSKSPGGDSLENFPQYIKTQALALKKYTKLEQVKNEAFFVVPHNTLEVLPEKTMSFGDYRVYVISEESLEPILAQLKRLEDYEFTESLSPENREAMVSVVGKMAHGMKRRIQVDQFFSKEFISILEGMSRLPGDLLTQVEKVEQVLKVNPPIENRKKAISSEDLVKDQERLSVKAESL